jgi:MoaA/NifB/PqqE/SkfB family radical SAM enzyme
MEAIPWAEVDEQGRLVLPLEVAAHYGLQPGARLRIEAGLNNLRFHRPVTHLAKLYIEPTDLCNLNCSMCIRSGWEEPLGRMTQVTFERIYTNIASLSPLPTVFFGGLGEPLFHPHTIEWIDRIKSLGARVELITNGTTLTEKRSRQLIDTGLDLLWISIDGASPEGYADLRLGAELPRVLSNLRRLRKMRPGGHHPHPEIGISFVAMKRNISELPAVIRTGRSLGAKRFSITNVMPYTEEMQDERLYTHTLRDIAYLSSPWLPRLSFPKVDLDEATREAFIGALKSGCNIDFAGNNLSGANDVCNFIESGSISVRWDGGVSPCWPLMHTHTSYLHGKPRRNRQHIIGNLHERDLLDIWQDAEYVAYRERVQSFAFAPCSSCGGCDLSEANEEDCIGNSFPACGGCMWAQGVIQCP